MLIYNDTILDKQKGVEMRKFMGYAAAAYLVLTNKRFNKIHRMNETVIYKLIDTVGANILANKIKNISEEKVILI